jgi:hypothetical protein
MRKYPLPILVSCLLVLASAPALAAPVELTVQPQEQSGQLFSDIKFSMTILNNQDYDDMFRIILSGEHLEWNMPSTIAKKVRADSSETIELLFYPTGSNMGLFDFTATVESLNNPDVKASAKFFINIPYLAAIKGFSASASGNTVSFYAILKTPEEKELKGEFALEDSSGITVGSVPFTETVNGEKEIRGTLSPPERLLAGTYTAYITIDGTLLSRNSSFTIQPVRSVSQKVEETSSGFSKIVLVSVTNEGNVAERNYAFQQKTPLDPMTGMLTKPADNCMEEGGEMVCNYLVGEIKPGATAQVSYAVSYWPMFNGYLLLTVIVIGLVLFSFLRATTPRIIKRHSGKGEDRHNISIHVINPFFHRLSDVVVRDWVSPLAQVLHEEIESSRPAIRSQDEGTELIWKLGDMKPREERILQYKVRSLVHGSLKMPGAQLKFTAGKGEKKIRLVSNGITLE